MSGENTDDPFVDPSIREGEEIAYCKEIVFDFAKDKKETQKILTIMKILTKTDEDGKLISARLELSMQSNVFFLYQAHFEANDYEELKKSERLKIEFDEFPCVLAEIFDKTGIDTDFLVQFETTNDTYLLKIKMPMRFKIVDIFAIKFKKASEELVHDSVQYRYNMVQYELRKTNIEIKNFLDVIRADSLKNKTYSPSK